MYAAVDKELGELFSLLTIGGEHIPSWEQRCAGMGITLDLLQAILKPYWEKVGCPVVALESVTPVLEASDEEKAQRSARLHAIRTYFMRKDCNLTQKRIDKMRSLIEEGKGYGLPTDEYEAAVAASIKEVESKKEEA